MESLMDWHDFTVPQASCCSRPVWWLLSAWDNWVMCVVIAIRRDSEVEEALTGGWNTAWVVILQNVCSVCILWSSPDNTKEQLQDSDSPSSAIAHLDAHFREIFSTPVVEVCFVCVCIVYMYILLLLTHQRLTIAHTTFIMVTVLLHYS